METSESILAEHFGKNVPTSKDVLEMFIQAEPGLHHWLCPRRTPTPTGYPDSRIWSQPAASQLQMMRAGQFPGSDFNGLATLSFAYAASQSAFPVFHVSKALAQAFTLTSVDPDMDLWDLPWPFPGFAIILPLDCGIQCDEGAAHCIIAAKLKPGTIRPNTPPSSYKFLPTLNVPEPGRIVIGTSVTEAPFTTYLHLLAPGEKYTGMEDFHYQTSEGETTITANASAEHAQHIASGDRVRAIVRNWLCLFLLYTSQKTEAFTGGEQTRKAKIKGARSIEALWAPRWVGEKYAMQRAPQNVPSQTGHQPSSGHASPRVHYRRGHTRNQAFGPSHSQRRSIWIEPMLVGA